MIASVTWLKPIWMSSQATRISAASSSVRSAANSFRSPPKTKALSPAPQEGHDHRRRFNAYPAEIEGFRLPLNATGKVMKDQLRLRLGARVGRSRSMQISFPLHSRPFRGSQKGEACSE